MAHNVTHDSHRSDAFWGPTTSTIDWCEENYHQSSLIAEFWNTLSNGFYIAVGFVGAWKLSHMPPAIVPRRLVWLYAWMGIIGLGSFLFHATLKYSMQLLDEIPMLFSNAQLLYCLWHPDMKLFKLAWIPVAWRRSPVGWYAAATAITLLYLFVPIPVLFQSLYGAMLGLVALSLHLMKLELFAQGSVVGDRVHTLLIRALLLLLLAFMLWNVDNVFCPYLRGIRSDERVPALLKPLFQLHAWWHIGTMLSGVHSLAATMLYWCEVRKLPCHLRYYFMGIFPWICLAVPEKASRNDRHSQ